MPRPLLHRLAVTAAAAWFALRLALGLLGVVRVTYPGIVVLAAAVLAVAWMDLRRNSELVLYANLGVSPVLVSAWVVAVTVAVELLVGVPIASLVPTPTDVVTP